MIRPISIEAVSNGWIATVGCQRVVYTDLNQMASELKSYLSNPEEYEKHFLSMAVNARHTNNYPAPPTWYGAEVNQCATAPQQDGGYGYVGGGAAAIQTEPDYRRQREQEAALRAAITSR